MRISFQTIVQKFGDRGEKTGWTYIEINGRQAQQLKSGNKVSFRVKGTLAGFAIERTAVLPMGDGSFILPLNAKIRKGTGKKQGDKLKVVLETDERKIPLSADLLKCLKAEPESMKFFSSLPPSHQSYFSKWIEEAKTATTKTKRLVMALDALSKRQGFPEMIRASKGR